MEFKDRLKELRAELHLTQKEVAEGSLLSPQCISQLEAGTRSPTGTTLISLANYFSCSVDYLLGRTDEYEGTYHVNPTLISQKSSPLDLHLVEMFRQLPLDLQHRTLTYVNNLLKINEEEKYLKINKK